VLSSVHLGTLVLPHLGWSRQYAALLYVLAFLCHWGPDSSLSLLWFDRVNSKSLFVTRANLPTRSGAGPLNMRLDVRQNFFSQRVVEEWNKIPSSIKMASSVKSFKNRYKKHRVDMVVPS
jgi:hypothetical protein